MKTPQLGVLAVLAACSVTSESPTPEEPESTPDFTCVGDSSAHENFNAFWLEFDKYYAVFDLRLPDTTWSQVGADYCDQVHEAMSDEALFDVLLSMAQELDDGHVELTARSIGRDEDAWLTEYPYYDEMYELELNVEDVYLDDRQLSWAADDWVAWGSIGDIGYISLTSMEELSGHDDEARDVKAAHKAMQRVMADLGGSKGLVVDVRANEGGWDLVSLAMAEWFAGDRTIAWSRARRGGPKHDDYSDWKDFFVEAETEGAYPGPVVVLTSGGTMSAAETFLLAMTVRDNVSFLGERSSGHFSDMIDGRLPNGWAFTYSGQRYRAADGNVYETQGVPVDLEMPFDVDAFAAGEDEMLETALALLQ